MYATLLDLANAARIHRATGAHDTASECLALVGKRLRESRKSSAIAGELRGRKPVDALLALALAGSSEAWMFDELAASADAEVGKWGHRRSCTSMTLVQIVERAAAAGCEAPLGVYERIHGILEARGEYPEVAAALAQPGFSLRRSAHAARWVYRASARVPKISSDGAAELGSGTDANWGADVGWAFADATRPLTVDLGCGYGCGPLSYVSDAAVWEEDNVLGCDLSHGGVGYGRGLARRWGVDGRARFVRDDARSVLRRLRADRYPGGVRRVVLSCPTPYSSATDALPPSGNAQLPLDEHDPTFLGNAAVFEEIHRTLAPGGLLYLASNVEDVAVTMLRTGEACGFEAHVEEQEAATPVALHERGAQTAPRRQLRWRDAGGERAEGLEWRSARQMAWASETERTYEVEQRPVHRVILRKA